MFPPCMTSCCNPAPSVAILVPMVAPRPSKAPCPSQFPHLALSAPRAPHPIATHTHPTSPDPGLGPLGPGLLGPGVDPNPICTRTAEAAEARTGAGSRAPEEAATGRGPRPRVNPNPNPMGDQGLGGAKAAAPPGVRAPGGKGMRGQRRGQSHSQSPWKQHQVEWA